MQADVAIIGAGPAGLSAAAVLARLGIGEIVVIEREPQPGGIPRHCGHSPFGMREFSRVMRGPAYATRLAAEARAAGARILCDTTATALLPGPMLELSTPSGVARLSARAVLLATGTREASRVQRMIGGQKPGGILTTGALQGMVHLNDQRPFQRPVVLGSELVAFSALLTCRQAGIRPIAMIEPGDGVTYRSPAALLPRLMQLPVLTKTRITGILGDDRVEAVDIAGPGGQTRLAADGVLLTGDFRSEATLPAMAGWSLDPRTTGPVIDSFGRLDQPGFFAAGNLLRPVETAGACWDEGRRAAEAITAYLSGALPDREQGARLHIASDAIRYALPQIVLPARPGWHERLQLRLSRPVRGELQLQQSGRVVARKTISSRPERRITLTLPPGLTDAPLILVLGEAA